jgi:FMN phosphatase YigB (HAD superfamily)
MQSGHSSVLDAAHDALTDNTTRLGMGIGGSKPAARGLIITFDALHTLYRFRKPVAEQYLEVAQKCGLKAKIQPSALDASFRNAFKSISADHPNYGKETLESPEQWWTELVQRAFKPVVNSEALPSDLSSSLYRHFSSGAAYELYPDVRPVLDRLKELKREVIDANPDDDGILLTGVITNSDPRVRNVLESMSLSVGQSTQLKLDTAETMRRAMDEASASRGMRMTTIFNNLWSVRRNFDFLATSYDADSEKPDQRIFNYAANLARLNVVSRVEQNQHDAQTSVAGMMSAARAIMRHRHDVESMPWIHIGDEYEKDYRGAKECGIDAFHLVREGSGKEAVKGAQTISTLLELLPVINIMVQENLLSPVSKSK